MSRSFSALVLVGIAVLFQACSSDGNDAGSGGAPTAGGAAHGGVGANAGTGGTHSAGGRPTSSGGSVAAAGEGSMALAGGGATDGEPGAAGASGASDGQAGASNCPNGTCAECTPGATRCSASGQQTCSADGNWLAEQACDANALCTPSGANAGGKCTCQPGWVGTGTSCTHVKRIFVTKHVYTGNLLAAAPGAASGLAAADAICNSTAQAAGLSGTYRTWLSSSTVNAIDRLTDVGPWYLLNAYTAPRYANKAAIVLSQPGQIVGIATTEDGSFISINESGVIVWTGTAGNGTNTNPAAPITFCGDWTIGLGNATGTYGFANRGVEDPSWTQYTGINAKCDTLAHLYCFEQ
jgi:hypothetical protein